MVDLSAAVSRAAGKEKSIMNKEKNFTGQIEGEELPFEVFRRPDPVDETDRIGRQIARRMIEAGVVETV